MNSRLDDRERTSAAGIRVAGRTLAIRQVIHHLPPLLIGCKHPAGSAPLTTEGWNTLRSHCESAAAAGLLCCLEVAEDVREASVRVYAVHVRLIARCVGWPVLPVSLVSSNPVEELEERHVRHVGEPDA